MRPSHHAETTWPVGVAATKFLALTGWRRAKRWRSNGPKLIRDANGTAARHKDRLLTAPLSHAACEILWSFPASVACVSGLDRE